MLAIAQIELGLSEQGFWDLPPAKCAALHRVRADQIFRRNYRAGVIVATIRTALGDPDARPMDAFERKRGPGRELIETAEIALRKQLDREAGAGGRNG